MGLGPRRAAAKGLACRAAVPRPESQRPCDSCGIGSRSGALGRSVSPRDQAGFQGSKFPGARGGQNRLLSRKCWAPGLRGVAYLQLALFGH